MFEASYAAMVNGELVIEFVSSFDMKGWFPVRLFNMMIGAMLGSMMKDVAKKMY